MFVYLYAYSIPICIFYCLFNVLADTRQAAHEDVTPVVITPRPFQKWRTRSIRCHVRLACVTYATLTLPEASSSHSIVTRVLAMDDSAVVMPLELGRNGEESESPEEEPIAPEEGCLPATVAMEFSRELRFRPLPKEKKCCPLPEPIRTSLTPPTAWQQWLQFLLLRIPILRWLWSYQPSYIIGDLISGITVAVMHIPQGKFHSVL